MSIQIKMGTNVFHLILFGMTYIILIYIVFVFMRKRKYNSGNDNDDDGGIEIFTPPPNIDLPPGVSLPGGPSHKIKSEEQEEILT